MNIFLDLHGLLADFVGGAAKAHKGLPNPYSHPESKGCYEMEKLWGMSTEDFYRPIIAKGYYFWANLDPTKEAGEIISLAHWYDPNVSILTSCLDGLEDCIKGTKIWVANTYPAMRDRIIFVGDLKAKQCLAHPDSVLIDDKDSNVDEWKAAGGQAFLFPRPWNSAHMFSPEIGLKELEKFLASLDSDDASASSNKLPCDPSERKAIPITTGVLDYFPLAIAEVAKCSLIGNEQHNPGEPLHWSRGKSTDHPNCISRHLIERGTLDKDGVRHSAKLAWRALALLQEEMERL